MYEVIFRELFHQYSIKALFAECFPVLHRNNDGMRNTLMPAYGHFAIIENREVIEKRHQNHATHGPNYESII